tara:strand:- start:6185 stop:6688 length:504 start_codon:yes stop_codon:yes gene_type:complete
MLKSCLNLIYAGIGCAITLSPAVADISKQAGKDTCKYMYLGVDSVENDKACLAPNGTVFCGTNQRKCGLLGVDYTVWSDGEEEKRFGLGSIYHWEQSPDARILTGYRCGIQRGSASQCYDAVKTAIFKYSHQVENARKGSFREPNIKTHTWYGPTKRKYLFGGPNPK